MQKCTFPTAKAYSFPARHRQLAADAKSAGFNVVDPESWICTATTCPAVVGNYLVYRDDTHLTTTFSAWLAPMVAPLLTATKRELTVLIGLLELRHSIQEHDRLYLFSIFVLLTWAIWMIKVVLSWRYRPWTQPYSTTTSVVIPVVDEPLDLFRDGAAAIIDQRPTQIIVVINGSRNPASKRSARSSPPPSSGPGRRSPASATRSRSASSGRSATSSCWSTATRSGPTARSPN